MKAKRSDRSPRHPPGLAASIWAVVLVLVGPASLTLADGDPIDDGLETVVCGFPLVKDTLDASPQEAGRCSGPDYVHPAFEPPACMDCDPEKNIHTFLDIPIHDNLSTPDFPGIEARFLEVKGFHEGGLYCIDARDGGGDPFEVGGEPVPLKNCFGGPVPGLLPPEEFEFLVVKPQKVPDVEQSRTLSIWVNYTADEDRVVLIYSGTAGELSTPVDLFDSAEVDWWRTNAYSTTINVTVQLTTIEGALTCAVCARHHQTDTWSLPYLGQVVAALDLEG